MKLLMCWLLSMSCLMAAELGPNDPQTDQYMQIPGDFNSSHILITHTKAKRPPQGIKRDKKAAEEIIDGLLEQLKADPSQFEALAYEHSEGPSAVKAGYMGGWSKDEMAQSFEGKVRKLEVGEISDEAITTAYGLHIIRRNPMWAKYYSARMILLIHKDALILPEVPAASLGLKRTREESEKLAHELHQSVTPENFMEKHAEFADLKADAKILKLFHAGEGYLGYLISKELEKMPYDTVSRILDLPVGFAILKREKVQKFGHSRLRVSYRGSRASPHWITRERKEARLLAKDLSKQIKADPSLFVELVKTHSNGPFAVRGGRVFDWLSGKQKRAVETAVRKLEIGDITPFPVKTPEGYHIYRREPLKPIDW